MLSIRKTTSIKGESGVKLTAALLFCTFLISIALIGCSKNPSATSGSAPGVSGPKVAGPLADNAFKAQIDVTNAPAKLRAGEKVSIEVHVKNSSDAVWYARGGDVNPNPDNKFYIAVGNRWSQQDDKLVTNMDGRYGLDKNLKPGESTTVPLQVTAPGAPGDYLLEIDLIQEQVAWFSDKGSPTAKIKVSVVR
jgi:hypothetical protein